MTESSPAARDDARRRPAWSVRLRLTALTAGLLCVALTVGAVALTAVLSRSRVAGLDEVLRERLAVVTGLVSDDRVPDSLPVTEPGEVAQVLDDSGRVVASSTNVTRTLPVLTPDTLAPLLEDDRGIVLSTRPTAYDPQARVVVGPATYRGEPVAVVVTLPLGEVQSVVRALAVALVGVVPLLTALLAWAIWTVLGRALRPVERMRQAAAQVARSGGPGSLPVPATQDEVAALARTLNEMLDRLEHAAARQRTFVADAAHELRSPLAALRTQIEVARTHPDAYPPGELAGDLEGEVLRMQALVDDLLLLARVGSGPRPVAPLALGDVAREAVELVRLAGAAEATVEVRGDGRALGDRPAVVRVVRNLLENAVRHAATRVVLTLRDAQVTVEDDGPGVPAEERERVFERFVRLGAAREREGGGSGLGLSIAREIAREHGGDVTLHDGDLGGLRAVLTLPPTPADVL